MLRNRFTFIVKQSLLKLTSSPMVHTDETSFSMTCFSISTSTRDCVIVVMCYCTYICICIKYHYVQYLVHISIVMDAVAMLLTSGRVWAWWPYYELQHFQLLILIYIHTYISNSDGNRKVVCVCACVHVCVRSPDTWRYLESIKDVCVKIHCTLMSNRNKKFVRRNEIHRAH